MAIQQPAGLSDNALTVLKKRYLQDGETPEDLWARVACAVAGAEDGLEDHERYCPQFTNLMSSLKFLPNSPTLVNAGRKGRGSLSACFVVSPEDTLPSIMKVASDAAMIEKWGGGIGFGFNKIRPKDSPIGTTHGKACGPVAVMRLYSEVGKTLTQGSFRLGAHMGQLSIDHPDIREFIHCKDGDDSLQNFNISVQVPDEFMHRVKNGEPEASLLWHEICESAWRTGDPGVVFMDRVHETNPNPHLGKIQSSNPCGEEFLEDYGNCCLGSINLAAHLNDNGIDYDELHNTVKLAVRFLDDVIEVNTFPLDELRDMNLRTRRIGLGVMGFADVLVRMGIPYDSQEALDLANKIGLFIYPRALWASEDLAQERGPFLEWKRSALNDGANKPRRHSSITTIAPTGTISRIAGCSSGIEPLYALTYQSNILWDSTGATEKVTDVPDSVRRVLGPKRTERLLQGTLEKEDTPAYLRTSMDISPEWHVKMQAEWQKWATNSVSKTINMPNEATINDVSNAYMLAWEMRCKATTVYRDGSKGEQVLTTRKQQSEKPVIVDENGKVAEGWTGISFPGGDVIVWNESPGANAPKPRPSSVSGETHQIKTAHGTMYVTINYDEGGKPFEVFSHLGKSGGCDHAQLEGISRLASLCFRSGVPVEEVVKQLEGITCCPQWDRGRLIKSGPDAIAYALTRGRTERSEPDTQEVHRTGQDDGPQMPRTAPNNRCPDCSGVLVHKEGCMECLDCGWTKCE